MGKRLILILALAFVVGLTVAAFAEVQNVKVSGDLEFDSVFRNQFDFVGKAINETDFDGEGQGDNIFLSIARVRVDADLTDNVSATVRLIGEWLWGKNDSNTSLAEDLGDGGPYAGFAIQRDAAPGIDIDLAYVTVKEFLCSPLTMVIGRQELHYGNEMIIGDSTTNQFDDRGNIPSDLSKRKSFDAVRAILNYDPLTVDLVYAKISGHPWWTSIESFENVDNNFERIGNRFDDDTDLFGVNANLKAGEVDILGLKLMNTVLEGYYWYRNIGPQAFGTGNIPGAPLLGTGDEANDALHTFGFRVAMEPIEDMMYSLEVAWQRGKANIIGENGGDRVAGRSAWALETGAGYNFKKVKYVPTLTMLFAYFSGDDSEEFNPNDAKNYRGWDPMFENQKYGDIVNAIMPQTNCKILGIIGTMKPMDDVMVKAEYYRYWFNDPMEDAPGYYTPLDPEWLSLNPNERDAAQELDVTAIYNYTEDVSFSLMGGWLWPGKALELDNNNVATEVIGSMKVSF